MPRTFRPYSQPEDNIIIAGYTTKLASKETNNKVNAQKAANNTGVTRSNASTHPRWTRYLKQSHGLGEEKDADGAGEGQGEDSMAEEEQDVQSEEEAGDEEESKEATDPQQKRNGSLAFRVELERATNRHNHEMESLRERGVDAEEEPQVLREASLDRELKQHAEEKGGRDGN